VKIGITAMVANMVMNLMFSLPLMYLFNIGHMGLALATSLAAMLNAGLLMRGLLRAGYYRFQPGWTPYTLRLLVASASMVAAIIWLAPEGAAWYDWHWPHRVLVLGLLCAVGVGVYFAALWLLGTRMRHLLAPASQ
jgi:putative peptidoglycan lipid II flippase